MKILTTYTIYNVVNIYSEFIHNVERVCRDLVTVSDHVISPNTS